MATKMVMTIFLGICSIQDIKKKAVAVWLLVAFAAAGIILQLIEQSREGYDILGGVLIGAAFVLCSLLSKGKMGMGDGLVLMITGICLGSVDNMQLIFYALLFAGGTAVVGLLLKKMKRRSELPFIPFVMAAYVVMICT